MACSGCARRRAAIYGAIQGLRRKFASPRQVAPPRQSVEEVSKLAAEAMGKLAAEAMSSARNADPEAIVVEAWAREFGLLVTDAAINALLERTVVKYRAQLQEVHNTLSMSLRDTFAMSALVTVATSHPQTAADAAYGIAEAMMQVRKQWQSYTD